MVAKWTATVDVATGVSSLDVATGVLARQR